MKNSWETRYNQNHKRESDKAFTLFKKYLKMGINRSLKELSENEGIDYAQIRQYSSKYEWKNRVQDYINHTKKEVPTQQNNAEIDYTTSKLTQTKDKNDKLNNTFDLMYDLFLQIMQQDTDHLPKNMKNLKPTTLVFTLESIINAIHINDKTALRFMGLPETIKDREDLDILFEIPEYATPEENKKKIDELLSNGSQKIPRKEENIHE